jgi:uncharacterized protein (DUF2236 family)
MHPSPKQFFNPPNEPIVDDWPETLNAKAWDKRYPGILDAVNVLAGSANVVMQLAWPAVGYGVKESRVSTGSIQKHPIKRTRTTLTYLAVALTGTASEKRAYRQAVNGAHAQVYSTAESPVKYHAMDPTLQHWVALCLYKGLVDVYSAMHQRPDIQHDEAFLQLTKPLATTLQVRANQWPASIAEFKQQWEDGLNKAHIDDNMRHYLKELVSLQFAHPLLRRCFGSFNTFITIGFLPPQLRDAMHYQWHEAEQKRFERILSRLHLINRCFPRVIRQATMTACLWDLRRRMKQRAALI